MARSVGRTTVKLSVRDSEKIIKRAQEQARRVIAQRIRDAENIIKDRVLLIIGRALNENRVVKALRGENAGQEDGSDLQAEFGLTDENKDIIVDILKEHVMDPDNITISSVRTSKTDRAIRINATIKYWDTQINLDVAADPRGVYESDSANFRQALARAEDEEDVEPYSVPWLEWSLFEGDTPVLSSDHGITYDVDSNPKRKLASRSGRAIMTREDADYSGPYIVPDFVKPVTPGAKTWLDEAMIQIRKDIELSIENIIRRQIQIRQTQRTRRR